MVCANIHLWKQLTTIDHFISTELHHSIHSSYCQHNTNFHTRAPYCLTTIIAQLQLQNCPEISQNHCSHSSIATTGLILHQSAALSTNSYTIRRNIRIMVAISLVVTLTFADTLSNLVGRDSFIPTHSPKCGFLIGWCFARQRMIGSVNGDDFRSGASNMIMIYPHRTKTAIPMAESAIPSVAPNRLLLVATALAAQTCMLTNLAYGDYR